MAKDLYSVLGLSRSASADEIKRAYRQLAKKYHPDQNQGNTAAQEKFKAITAAYDILGDAKKRKDYDAGAIDESGNQKSAFSDGFSGGFGRGGGGERRQSSSWSFESGGSPEDIFQDLFGNFGSRFTGANAGGGARAGFDPRQARNAGGGGRDVKYEITVDFLDAARGAEKTLSLQGAKTINVKIPAGLKDGQQIRLAGQGDAGPFGGKAGDALITVNVRPHKDFTRDGNDIKMSHPIALDVAVLGGKVTVPTISGSVSLKVPAGTSSGKTMRLRAKGIHPKGKPPGDQLVTFMVQVPTGDEALEKAIEAWAQKRAKDSQPA